MYDKSNKGKVVIKEAGPRFEMDLYEIRLGTMDQDTAEKVYPATVSEYSKKEDAFVKNDSICTMYRLFKTVTACLTQFAQILKFSGPPMPQDSS